VKPEPGRKVVFKISDLGDKLDTLKFEPVSSKKVSEVIFEQIRDKIIKGELKPNDRLPSERALINIFHRSRPTIREALRMLERAGFIETIPGSGGAVIKEVSPSTVQQPLVNMILLKRIKPSDLYEYRILNEIAFVEWAVERRSDDDIKRMREIVQQAEKCGSNWSEFFRYDIEFHKAIVESGKNEMAKIIHQVISQLISDIISKGFMNLSEKERRAQGKNVIEMHYDMIDAIEKRDMEKAKALMIEHLNKFKRFVEDEKIN
jgi:GntR family transcriptional repressor for pyruvate dehydrogenase complex